MISLTIVGGIGVFIVAWFDLCEAKTRRWRRIERRFDALAYLAVHSYIILASLGLPDDNSWRDKLVDFGLDDGAILIFCLHA